MNRRSLLGLVFTPLIPGWVPVLGRIAKADTQVEAEMIAIDMGSEKTQRASPDTLTRTFRRWVKLPIPKLGWVEEYVIDQGSGRVTVAWLRSIDRDTTCPRMRRMLERRCTGIDATVLTWGSSKKSDHRGVSNPFVYATGPLADVSSLRVIVQKFFDDYWMGKKYLRFAYDVPLPAYNALKD